jgi:hypothetical protein
MLVGDAVVASLPGYPNNDAALIAAAKNNMPALLDALDEQQREIDRLQVRCEAVEKDLCGQCDYCKYRREFPCKARKCGIYGEELKWEWRGPQGQKGEKG